MYDKLVFAAATPGFAAARLGAGDIHLWRIPYVLSQGRAPLLAMLAAYLGVPASTVALDQDPRGKPRLAASCARLASGGLLDFNWSHSSDYALIALACDCALGVDIERLGKNLRALDIARRFFDPAEAGALERLQSRARDEAFIALWCAKEAMLKAAGEGLSFGLSRLVFNVHNNRDWMLAQADPALGPVADWRLRHFDPVAGYRGALAWRGEPRRVVAFRPDD